MIPAELYVFEYVLGCVLYCVEETVKLKIINFISAHTHTHCEVVAILHGA